MAPTSAPRRPRTQAERREETRTALLDATIACLVSHGYARTTTGRIAEIAGVSRGAQLPYFRSRSEIVAAAVAHLAERRIAAFSATLGEREVSLEECLDGLWEGHQGPMFDATLELWVASRTEADLRADLLRIERDVAVAIAAVARKALGDRADRPGFTEDLVYALATIRGLLLLQLSNGASSRAVARHWAHARGQLLELLR